MEIRCVCLEGHADVCFCVELWLVWSQRSFSPIRRRSSWLPLACWTMSEDLLYLMGRSWALQRHQWVCACVSEWDQFHLGVSFLCAVQKQFVGAVAGLRPCTRVQRCESRWWYVEGDNEQSAILTGWALSCQWQRCYSQSHSNSPSSFFLFLKRNSKRMSYCHFFYVENWQQRWSWFGCNITN